VTLYSKYVKNFQKIPSHLRVKILIDFYLIDNWKTTDKLILKIDGNVYNIDILTGTNSEMCGY
jgi:hypothetical protein